MHKSRGLALAAVGMTALVAVSTTTAEATPPSGVSATIISKYTAGGKDFVLREIMIAPGGTTGWHWHDGTLIGVVKRGTLTHDEADCSVDGVYHAGDPIVEPAGSRNVHIGRNLGTTPLVLDVLYIDPAGSPFSEDAPDPGCGFH